MEGMVVGDAKWTTLARHRAKLILSALGPKELHVQEIGERLALWGEGKMEELARRAAQMSRGE
eukprot:1425641-Lingulodinium_polyedra.AAC.1